MKRKLVSLLNHCGEGAEKFYGIKFDVKTMKKSTLKDRYANLKKIYQPEFSTMQSRTDIPQNLRNHITLKTKLRARFSSLNGNTKNKLPASKPPMLTCKLAANRYYADVVRSLSNSGKRRAESLNRQLPPLESKELWQMGMSTCAELNLLFGSKEEATCEEKSEDRSKKSVLGEDKEAQDLGTKLAMIKNAFNRFKEKHDKIMSTDRSVSYTHLTLPTICSV
eukprot:TRINITY_DN11065_c0_g1_i2.p1 TRINITY_DN11065_c0_g1~~TRINITY_DN11065_c0_g1_i2.p1  ORF type:complete len:222 (-),score=49.73 TRINITY_DN11065_c0_g1_i2:37-702(-)